MAIRQYIGARYVPKFVGTYDPTTQYEALDVVDNGAGTSYIARKIVPPGTALTDPEYWFLYGSSSGAIIQLQNDMSAAQNDISNLQLDVTDIKKQLPDISDRKFIFMGDSYGETYTDSGQTITGWLDQIINLLQLTASQYTNSVAESGRGFLANNKPWLDILNTYSSDDDVTDVIFIGGHNDAAYVADNPNLPIYIENTIAKAKLLYKNAKIWIGYCNIETSGNIKIAEVNKIYYDNAIANGALYMGGLEYCLLNPALILNHAHPNTNGTKAMAYVIANILTGGAGSYNKNNGIVTYEAGATGIESSGHTGLRYSIQDNQIIIDGDNTTNFRWQVDYTSPGISYRTDGAQLTIIDKLKNVPIMPQGGRVLRLGNVNGFAVFTNKGIVDCWVTFVIVNNYLGAYLIALDETRSYFTDQLVRITVESPHFVTECINGSV